MLKTFWKKFHNIYTIISSVSLLVGVAVFLLGTFLPSTQWDWVTPQLAQIMSIVGFIILGLAVGLFILGVFKTKSENALPSFEFMFGIKKDIWQLYKIQQKAVEIAGAKGLDKATLNKVTDQIRHDWKTKVQIIPSPLNQGQTDQFINSMNKKMGIKNGLNKKALDMIFRLGSAIDKCDIGVSSILKTDLQYTQVKDRLDENRLATNKTDKIKQLKLLSYSLNSLLLSIFYIKPLANEISPEHKLPIELCKLALDEEMQDNLKKL